MILIDLQYSDIHGTVLEKWTNIDDENFLIAKIIVNVGSLCMGLFFFIPLRSIKFEYIFLIYLKHFSLYPNY